MYSQQVAFPTIFLLNCCPWTMEAKRLPSKNWTRSPSPSWTSTVIGWSRPNIWKLTNRNALKKPVSGACSLERASSKSNWTKKPFCEIYRSINFLIQSRTSYIRGRQYWGVCVQFFFRLKWFNVVYFYFYCVKKYSAIIFVYWQYILFLIRHVVCF